MITMLWRNKKFHIEKTWLQGLKYQMEMLRLDRVGKGVTEGPEQTGIIKTVIIKESQRVILLTTFYVFLLDERKRTEQQQY